MRLDHEGPWSEQEYFALGRTPSRVELIDGGLWVSPGPSLPHQGISYLLHSTLRPAARAAGLKIFEGINVRVRPEQLLIPDLAVVAPAASLETVVEAAEVTLVAEIVSPSSKTMDRVQKNALYAAAGIPWYLLVEPDYAHFEGVALTLFRLTEGRYVETAVAKIGETLVAGEPFPIEIRTGDLLDL